MDKQAFYKSLCETKKIAAIRDPKSLDQFLRSELKVAILLTGNISVIKRYVDEIKRNDRYVFLHLEKIGGISCDREGLKFIANYVKPIGIVSTKSSLIQLANKVGLLTIQRLFLVDSEALINGIEQVNDSKPDFLEVMPGVIPDVIRDIHQQTHIPIITGGLIKNQEQINLALESGAVAISTAKVGLWKVNTKQPELIH